MQKQTLEEWKVEATQRFGPDMRQWRFQCPSCKSTASVSDFLAKGLDASDSYQECIKRYENVPLCVASARGPQGTLGKGRIVLIPTNGGGYAELEVFDFAERGA